MTRDRIFVSYSHEDRRWLEELNKFLGPLVRKQQIELWDDTKLRAGERWLEAIQGALASARVAVLLVSANYLASKFIVSEEIPRVLAAQEQEGLRVIWIPVSASAYAATPVKHFRAACDPSRPLDSVGAARRNKLWVEIAEAIVDAISSSLVEGPTLTHRLAEENTKDDLGSLLGQLEQDAARAGIEVRSVGAIVCHHGQVLVLVRSDRNAFLPGWGDLPGGYALSGETLLEALERETTEETGLKIVRVLGYVGAFDFRTGRGLRARQFNFHVELSGSHISLNLDEHSSYTWCDPRNTDELKRLRVSPEVRSIFANMWKDKGPDQSPR